MKENAQPIVAREEILGALSKIKDPDLGRDIVTLGFVKDLQITGMRSGSAGVIGIQPASTPLSVCASYAPALHVPGR